MNLIKAELLGLDTTVYLIFGISFQFAVPQFVFIL